MASNGPAPSTRSEGLFVIPAWLLAALLLIGTAAAGFVVGGLAKFLFLAACLPLGWYAWQQSPAMHVTTSLVIFSFAPLVRRLVDLTAGFDESSIMLVGPLLVLMGTFPSLLIDLNNRTLLADRRIRPLLILLICILYAITLTIFRGQWNNAIVGGVKWLIPLFYAAALIRFGDREDVVEAATKAFTWILPLSGLYGIYQFVSPPEWDRYWMQFASILSAGLPEPYEVRTFATLNSPGTFGVFTAIGLILVTFLRPVVIAVPLAAPAAVSLLLSQTRSVWLGMALVLLFALWSRGTRARSGLIFAGIIAALMVALTIPTFADVILLRLESFLQGSQDHSVQERMQQFILLWNNPDPWDAFFGIGFTTVDVGVAGSMAIDGMFIESWLMLGLFVGPIYLLTFIWVNLTMVKQAIIEPNPRLTAAAGLAFFTLFQIPFGSFSSGELEYIFWIVAAFSLCVGVSPGRITKRERQRPVPHVPVRRNQSSARPTSPRSAGSLLNLSQGEHR